MSVFATGKIATAICDRCGAKVLLRDLRKQIINERDSGLLVCEECLDIDHPQLQLGRYPIFDPQALKNPRPDSDTDASNDPQLVGYIRFGIPVFSTFVTPNTAGVVVSGMGLTTRR